MLITNDVALLTFVPFSFAVLGQLPEASGKKLLTPVVCLQTIAANLGSMLTPIGNPQNLYLYGKSPFPLFYSSCSLIRCCLPSCFLSAFSIWDIRIGSKQSLPQSRIRLQTLHKKAGADPALHRFVFLLPPCRFACASLPGSLCSRPFWRIDRR